MESYLINSILIYIIIVIGFTTWNPKYIKKNKDHTLILSVISAMMIYFFSYIFYISHKFDI